ncbi:UBX domain-containing protein 7-like isoform X2 [Clavelina lepadiformis]|uniref:UBX domain-containing protein n=1 Tax=Clavelina lepadiformis TaxID=159417 RepID=A0ABP0GFR2_CLALP
MMSLTALVWSKTRIEIPRSYVKSSNQNTACHFLEACSNNLQSAVTTFLDGGNVDPSTKDTNSSGVREPIPQKQDVLVDVESYPLHWTHNPRQAKSVFDGFQDKNEELEDSKQRKKLGDLFRLPMDMIHRGSFQSARDEGVNLHKWVMVNIHNVKEFACQALNRDVWSNKNVKSLVKKHFVFWQVRSDSLEGEKFMMFYSVSNWPYIAVIDPRTGGCLTTWSETTSESFIASVKSFLDEHESLNPALNGKRPVKHSILDETEDSQIAAAIAMSLKETRGRNDGSVDEDTAYLLTQSSTDEDTPKKDKLTSGNTLRASTRKLDCRCSPIDDPDRPVSENGENQTKRKLVKIFPKKRPSEKSDLNHFQPSSKYFKHSINSSIHEDRIDLTHEGCSSLILHNGTSRDEAPVSGKCKIMLRFPDGSRQMITMNASDTIQDFTYVVALKNYDLSCYELLTNFPRRLISSMPSGMTLEYAGLCPQETVFIQEKMES